MMAIMEFHPRRWTMSSATHTATTAQEPRKTADRMASARGGV